MPNTPVDAILFTLGRLLAMTSILRRRNKAPAQLQPDTQQFCVSGRDESKERLDLEVEELKEKIKPVCSIFSLTQLPEVLKRNLETSIFRRSRFLFPLGLFCKLILFSFTQCTLTESTNSWDPHRIRIPLRRNSHRQPPVSCIRLSRPLRH